MERVHNVKGTAMHSRAPPLVKLPALPSPLVTQATLERVYNKGNAADLESQPYYRWLRATYPWHVVAQFAALFLLGGFPAVVSARRGRTAAWSARRSCALQSQGLGVVVADAWGGA